ncbi:MAG: hypothetical protein K8T91_16985, partial [Planctomycetes bacterium]|nr:hypothetical protein [Planctomycetota bacterium]
KPAIEEIEAAGKTGGSVTVDENGKVVITPAQKSEDRGQGSGVRGQGSELKMKDLLLPLPASNLQPHSPPRFMFSLAAWM